MNRSVAIAYSLASAAVAIALVVIIGSTVGFDRDNPQSEVLAAPMPYIASAAAPGRAAVPEGPIVVYEDVPAGGQRRHDDHEDEHDEEDEEEEEDEEVEHEDERRERGAGRRAERLRSNTEERDE